MENRIKNWTDKPLHEGNLVKAIDTRVIPVVSYVMNVCSFRKKQLHELNHVIKQELKLVKMNSTQTSDDRLYTQKK